MVMTENPAEPDEPASGVKDQLAGEKPL